jgi:nitrite reductase/ring-hydroxylating ferredoxin subunit
MSSKLNKIIDQSQTKSETKVEKKAMNLPASWYVAMPSKALGKKPLAIELFGQHLVVWRDQKGHPVIMERYCSHLGASLAIGKVVEGCIQCPFHHWRFDNSGHCVFIPEVDRIPPMARQVNYVTAERYGFIWVWYGSETPLFPLPMFSAAEDERDNYMPLRFANPAKTTVQRVVENQYDYTHIPALHELNVTNSIQMTLLNDQSSVQQSEPPIKKEAWFGAVIEARIKKYFGPIGTVAQALGINAETFTMQVDGWPSGILFTVFVNGEERWRALKCTTPVAENNTIEQVLIMVKKTGKFWLDILYYVIFGLQNRATSAQDVPVWNTMKSDGGRVFVKHDLTLLKFREFYQSWVDMAD